VSVRAVETTLAIAASGGSPQAAEAEEGLGADDDGEVALQLADGGGIGFLALQRPECVADERESAPGPGRGQIIPRD
jgi:hypothetical protein